MTGGSRGVGAEVARLLAEAGVRVAVNYRDKARRAESVVRAVEAAGSTGIAVKADITDAASVDAMMNTVEESFGGLDILILNASGGLEKDVAADYAMRINRDAQVRLVEAAFPYLNRGGRIVFVTSHLAHFHGEKPVMPEYEVVAESKRAGETRLRELMPRLGEHGLDLVVVSGDLIDGTITPKLLDRRRPGVIAQRREEAGRLPTTEEFAVAIVEAVSAPHTSGDTVFVGSTEW